MNKLREIVLERPMSSARVFHILTVRMKKDLWCVVVLHFLGTNKVTYVLLLHTFLYFFGLTEPPPLKFQSLLWGEFGYFLELHIVVRCDIQIKLNKYIKLRQSPCLAARQPRMGLQGLVLLNIHQLVLALTWLLHVMTDCCGMHDPVLT